MVGLVIPMFFTRKRGGRSKNVALFVDGPNIIRREFGIDLDELRRTVEKYGRIVTGKVFLNQHAPDKLIEAVANQGFEPKVVLAGEQEADVDVSVAVEIVNASYNDKIDVIALASRDADYLPAIQLAKEKGKTIVIVAMNPGFSKALQNVADHVELLSKRV
jgi:uncharacterized protein (TIGR00288 family)